MKRWEPSPLSIIISIGAVIRIPALSQMLWYDESYTALLAHLPVRAMIEATLQDVHPPTYYFLPLLFSRLFGWNEVALRLPSFALGLFAIYLSYRFAAGLFDHRIGLVTAGLMAFNPLMVYYSAEARMYALLTVAVLLALVGMVERRWWLLGVGTGLMLLSHNLAVIYLPALVLLVGATYSIRRYTLKPSMAMVAGAAPWVLWLPEMYHQATTGQFGTTYWITYFTGNPIAKLLSEWTQLWFPHFRPEWTARIGALVVFSLLVFPVVEAVRRHHMAALVCAALAVVPGITALVVSVAWQPVILARTLIGSLPPWGALVAWWLLQHREWNRGKLGIMTLAALVVLSCDVALFSYERSGNMRAILNYLTENAKTEEMVCHSSESTGVFFAFYYHGASSLLGNVSSDECDWLLDERYTIPNQQVYDQADELIHRPESTRIMVVLENPIVKTDLWRLAPVP